MAEARMFVDAMTKIRKDERLREMPEIDVTLFLIGGTRIVGTVQRIDTNGKYVEMLMLSTNVVTHVDLGSVTHAQFRLKR